MSSKIRLAHISKYFQVGRHSVQTLNDVSLDVGAGEFVTLVGPSGCGKSTLFSILAGLAAPEAGGELFIDGRPRPMDHLLGGVAFMPQRDMMFPWRNVIDNAIVAAEIDGVPRRVARERAARALEQFGLSGFGEHYPAQLSGGMRQRVALLRTFMFERDIMLLDEPFGALDALTRSLMQRWLLDVWEANRRTVLFITHDIDEAIFLGDRVVVMSARPGSIRSDIAVPMPRPRLPGIVTDSTFVRLKRQLLDVIEEESLKAFAAVNCSGAPDAEGPAR